MALERTERLALWYLFCSLAGLSTNIGATDVGASEPGSNERAQWIWCVPDRAPRVRAVFQRAFELDQLPTSAWLRCAGESAGLELFINGAPVASRDPYDPLFLADVVESLRRGMNTISVQAASCEGPSAFFLQLELTLRDGSRKTIATDRQWLATVSGRSTGMPAVEFGVVDDKLLVPIERRVEIVATDNYEQWRQASGAASAVDGARFVMAPGFEIQLVRTAAPSEGSWVSMAFDRAGRLIVAKEKKGLLRLTLTEDGGAVRQVESIDDRLEECRGLLCVGEDLFANANNSKALYRLVGDGKGGFREPQVVFASMGGVGHGRNDLALGPDGMIYTIHGDAVDLPKKAKDFTSPFREARCGRTTREGHLLRVDPRSGKVEILLSGLRNPFGIAFNRDGEAFTYDADAEYDMGAPWYRPTRVNHLVVGGDYGWRGVTKQWPPYYPDHPDNALPNLGIGESVRSEAIRKLRAAYPDRSFEVNRLLSEILVREAPRDSVVPTMSLLRGAVKQAEQLHYLFVLRRVREGWSLDDRRDYFRALAGARSYMGGDGMPGFLRKIREEAVGTLRESEREGLGDLVNEPEASDDGSAAPPRPLVRRWTVDEAWQAVQEVGRPADAARGAELFAMALCVKCHRIGTRGTAIGPDLTSVSRRFGRRDLLSSIIEPSKVIAEKYRSVQLNMADGRSFVGQIVLVGDYRSQVLHLATDPMHPSRTIEIPKNEIEEQRDSPVSFMPQALLDTLTAEEIADLLAYIATDGG